MSVNDVLTDTDVGGPSLLWGHHSYTHGSGSIRKQAEHGRVEWERVSSIPPWILLQFLPSIPYMMDWDQAVSTNKTLSSSQMLPARAFYRCQKSKQDHTNPTGRVQSLEWHQRTDCRSYPLTSTRLHGTSMPKLMFTSYTHMHTQHWWWIKHF